MGEFALDQTGNEIKIGTCENMYYLRYEDRFKVRPKPGNINPQTELNLYWRLPFPAEDTVQPGFYEDAFKRVQLPYAFEEMHMKDTVKNPGSIQLHSDGMGIYVHLTCYHNQQLPESSKDCRPFFNGKSPAFSLIAVTNTENGVRFKVSCNGCRTTWLCDIEDIGPFIYDKELKARLVAYTVIEKAVKEEKADTIKAQSVSKGESLLSWSF